MPIVLSLVFACLASEPGPPEEPVAAAAVGGRPTTSDAAALKDRAADLGLSLPLRDASIAIDKSERRLELFSGDTLVKTYGVGLADAVGDKVRQGDRKTPTGSFRVVTRNPESQYHLFLGLSYPTAEDAERGLEAKLVTEPEAQAIREADAAGRMPPWNTTLGGAIGIHGRGGDSDWTLGCIAVSDAEIEELWAATQMGAVVSIEE